MPKAETQDQPCASLSISARQSVAVFHINTAEHIYLPPSLITFVIFIARMEQSEKLLSNEIRLLILLPGKWSDPIHCRWRVVSLNGKPEYKALSYVWGRSKHSQPIYLNGSPVYITRHLRRALRQLRRDSEAVCLWVDAVCINQSDDEEKTEQVKMMGKIYAQSQEVVVYLGDAFAPSFSQSFSNPSGTSDAIAHTITPHECYYTPALNEKDTGLVWRRQMSYKDGSYLFCFIQLLADEVDMNSFMAGKDQGSLDEVMEALRLFLSAVKWWKRVWVIQEVVIASRIMILYGSMIAPWEMFVKAANRVHGNPQMQIPSLAVNDMKVLAEFSRRIRSIESIRARWQSPEQITLLQLLRQFSGREATDPRDKVYALLGLAKDQPTVEPNYAASELDVFVDTALDIISRSKSLCVLMGDFTMKNNHALPSWAPDWSSPFDASIQIRVESVTHYTACKDSNIDVRLEAPKELLSAYQNGCIGEVRYLEVVENYYRPWRGPMFLRLHEQGRISLPALSVEPIMAVGETMWSDAVLISTISSWLAMIAEYSFLLEKMMPREDFESTMCADLVFDFVAGGSRRLSPSDRDLIGCWLAREVPDYRDGLLLRPYRLMEDTADLSAQTLNSNSIRSSIIQATYRRRFFITAHGRIGLGPASMEKGDRVCVLPGGRTPFILRRRHLQDRYILRRSLRRLEFHVEFPTAYELLGDCYVRGLMDGEGISRWERVGSDYFILGDSPYVHSMDHEKKCVNLQEAGTRWKLQASNWYQSAEAWQDAYSAFWEQLKESESLLHGDHSSRWQIAGQDYDIICQSWARVQLTWEKSLKACQEFLDSIGDFGWQTIFREWHDKLQFLDSAILAWQSTKTCSQHSLQACEQEIRQWMEVEKNLIDWSLENISRRYDFIEKLMLCRLEMIAEYRHTHERQLDCMTRYDWQRFAEEWMEFADGSGEQAIPWKILADAQKKVWVTERSLGRIFQNLAEAPAYISGQDLYTSIIEWKCQLEEWELAAKKLKEEGLHNCKEAVKAAENALLATYHSEEHQVRLKSLIAEVGREKFAMKHLDSKLGMECLVVILV
ncbi:heterokaryon incompatibility protein-domain-containing protein [Aspergillus sergii]|uniref:Heterokaryon incompatibility protein-domain-containing protein n=1 Tax=Aspergillus sergii TaxID=1034303 RepID=A0A5N6XAK8_9EURO|nr:heterokaryon incompatibility protein-domain-containing protein [Aspergillus sergii]